MRPLGFSKPEVSIFGGAEGGSDLELMDTACPPTPATVQAVNHAVPTPQCIPCFTVYFTFKWDHNLENYLETRD